MNNDEINPRIKWKKLQKICNSMTVKKVEIGGATNLPDSMMAGVKITDDTVTILVNLNHVKDLDTLIIAISHEMAHVLVNSSEHTLQHSEVQERIKVEIRNNYGD